MSGIGTGRVNPLSAKPIKWSNTLKQFVGKLPTNCLILFDNFVELVLKGKVNITVMKGFSWFHVVLWRFSNSTNETLCNKHLFLPEQNLVESKKNLNSYSSVISKWFCIPRDCLAKLFLSANFKFYRKTESKWLLLIFRLPEGWFN